MGHHCGRVYGRRVCRRGRRRYRNGQHRFCYVPLDAVLGLWGDLLLFDQTLEVELIGCRVTRFVVGPKDYLKKSGKKDCRKFIDIAG